MESSRKWSLAAVSRNMPRLCVAVYVLAFLAMLCGEVAPVYAEEYTESQSLKVMTFNLRVETTADGENQWIYRREAVADLITNTAPAVIGTQEVTYSMLLDLEDLLPAYSWVGEGRNGDTRGEYSAIFYRKDMLALLDSGNFWLSNEPLRPGSRYPGVSLPRMATWARFRERVSGREFLVYNTHFDHQSQAGREFEGRAIRLHVESAQRKYSLPVVVMGDLNCESTNKALIYLQFADDGRTVLTNTLDWARKQGAWVGTTYHGFQGYISGEPIDHILLTPGWQIRSYSILNDPVKDRFPSDHYPVLVDLAFTHPTESDNIAAK